MLTMTTFVLLVALYQLSFALELGRGDLVVACEGKLSVFSSSFSFRGHLADFDAKSLDLRANGDIGAIGQDEYRSFGPTGQVSNSFSADELGNYHWLDHVGPEDNIMVASGRERYAMSEFSQDGAFVRKQGDKDYEAVVALPHGTLWAGGTSSRLENKLDVIDAWDGDVRESIPAESEDAVALYFCEWSNSVLALSGSGNLTEYNLDGSVRRIFDRHPSPAGSVRGLTRGPQGVVFAVSRSNRELLSWSPSGEALDRVLLGTGPECDRPVDLVWYGHTCQSPMVSNSLSNCVCPGAMSLNEDSCVPVDHGSCIVPDTPCQDEELAVMLDDGSHICFEGELEAGKTLVMRTANGSVFNPETEIQGDFDVLHAYIENDIVFSAALRHRLGSKSTIAWFGQGDGCQARFELIGDLFVSTNGSRPLAVGVGAFPGIRSNVALLSTTTAPATTTASRTATNEAAGSSVVEQTTAPRSTQSRFSPISEPTNPDSSFIHGLLDGEIVPVVVFSFACLFVVLSSVALCVCILRWRRQRSSDEFESARMSKRSSRAIDTPLGQKSMDATLSFLDELTSDESIVSDSSENVFVPRAKDSPELWFELSTPSKLVEWKEALAAESFKIAKGNAVLEECARRGIPPEQRSHVWPQLLRISTDALQSYSRLCKRTGDVSGRVREQIGKDINRTFPQDPKGAFRPGAVGCEPLERILLAYALFDSDVAYCQGMNVIAATLLTFLPEDVAFGAFVAVMQNEKQRDFFVDGFPGLARATFIFSSLLEDHLPRVAIHFRKLGISLSSVTTELLMTVFAGVLPLQVTAHVWDVLFSQPSTVEHDVFVQRVMIAIFAHLEEPILAETSMERCLALFSTIGTFFTRSEVLIAAARKSNVTGRRVRKLSAQFSKRGAKTMAELGM